MAGRQQERHSSPKELISMADCVLHSTAAEGAQVGEDIRIVRFAALRDRAGRGGSVVGRPWTATFCESSVAADVGRPGRGATSRHLIVLEYMRASDDMRVAFAQSFRLPCSLGSSKAAS